MRTSQDFFAAPRVLVATSVWGRPQLASLGIDVPVHPHVAEMCFFQTPLGDRRRLHRIMFDSRAKLYMRPEGERQMFVGRKESDFVTQSGTAIDPDNYRQTATWPAVRQMHRNLAVTLPFMADGFVHRTYACAYDMTPDQMPILDQAESAAGLFFAMGFSGGGFSMSPWVGKRLATWIAEGTRPPDIKLFELDRFRRGDLIQWSNTPDEDNQGS